MVAIDRFSKNCTSGPITENILISAYFIDIRVYDWMGLVLFICPKEEWNKLK